MPVSKKRKKKRRSSSPSPPPNSKSAPTKPKITTQRILLYVISGVMILSLAASFIMGSSGRRQVAPADPDTQTEATDGDNLLTDPPVADDEVDETTSAEEEPTAEETADEATDSETKAEETPDSAEEDTSVDGGTAESDTEN